MEIVQVLRAVQMYELCNLCKLCMPHQRTAPAAGETRCTKPPSVPKETPDAPLEWRSAGWQGTGLDACVIQSEQSLCFKHRVVWNPAWQLNFVSTSPVILFIWKQSEKSLGKEICNWMDANPSILHNFPAATVVIAQSNIPCSFINTNQFLWGWEIDKNSR